MSSEARKNVACKGLKAHGSKLTAPLLVLGTGNRKKGLELAGFFAPAGLELLTLADLPDAPDEFPDALDVAETGTTFAANAVLKATEQAGHLKGWVLADDSGLAVDALGGRPGVLSARYSGPDANDQSNNRRLLDELARTPLEKRTAQFVCHICLADPTGAIRAEAEASCRGRILFAARGEHGFGYDPLFEIVEYHRTFGQLGPVVKACLSHRARAARLILPALIGLLD